MQLLSAMMCTPQLPLPYSMTVRKSTTSHTLYCRVCRSIVPCLNWQEVKLHLICAPAPHCKDEFTHPTRYLFACKPPPLCPRYVRRKPCIDSHASKPRTAASDPSGRPENPRLYSSLDWPYTVGPFDLVNGAASGPTIRIHLQGSVMHCVVVEQSGVCHATWQAAYQLGVARMHCLAVGILATPQVPVVVHAQDRLSWAFPVPLDALN